jgi:hypothetical protein
MKKIIYFCVLLTCYQTQATLGNVVDFVTKVTQEYSKEERKESKPYIVAQEEASPITTLTGEFMKGFARTASPALLFVAYKISFNIHHNGSVSDADLSIEPHVTLFSGAVCLDECIAHGDVVVSGLKKEAACNRCVQPISHMHRLKELARIAGSVTAVALLVMMTSAKEVNE